MPEVAATPCEGFEFEVPVLIVGGGGTGLCAALGASDHDVDALVVERDGTPLGSTAMSTGLIPACGTPEQAAAGIEDSPARFAQDINAKTHGSADTELVDLLTRECAETVRWLRDDHGVPLALQEGWVYPGHSARRMYGTPNRSGGELMAALERAVSEKGIPVLTKASVDTLYETDGLITGIRIERPDGQHDLIGCKALVLASSGFGGNAEMVAHYIPEMAGAVYHGHPGNKGDALGWGGKLGAKVASIGAYQGHGGLAVGFGVPILWPAIMVGGFQINSHGRRFSDESAGYSEQASLVNAQPGAVAWYIMDRAGYELMSGFDDFRDAIRAGAIEEAADETALAESTGVPLEALCETIEQMGLARAGDRADEFGRDFSSCPPLRPPFYAAKVTGALFHTQGGLCVDSAARVIREDGIAMANLFAGGGAAQGISGDGSSGYLAGNGLLAATTLGKIAGHSAALFASGCQTGVRSD